MKAEVVYNNRINKVAGDLTFNKSLNLYKVATKSRNVYIPGSTLDYAVEVETPVKRRSSRRRKK